MSQAKPFAVGLNCALGASDMKPYVENLSKCADCYVFAYPNAGLPNAMGGYDQKDHEMAAGIISAVAVRLPAGMTIWCKDVMQWSVNVSMPETNCLMNSHMKSHNDKDSSKPSKESYSFDMHEVTRMKSIVNG